ncbi:UDP-glucuronic acid decarboxylase family protein [Halorubrum lipolyticum]|uniref:Nucleoside-diphosphate-sugar epimerase n=1 Tax=Halorubrum lipolyticum DSM 21995 TaxID=1227482 RepID=M0NZ22_9EURY|nr:UDP-glucuronic acid decarboxylase family protein [Halorubrum lipolyticum]EMA63066.1 nucleoside-diphosphate-sugar epimerase [Halorubrum lipolyticum DSM 21995]
MAKRTMVTGCGGFLGSHLVDELLQSGREVIGIDNFSSGQKENISEYTDHNNFKLLNRNVRLPDSLPTVDEIYHLASQASPADFTEYPVEIALVNTQGTRNMLDHALACDAKMVFASTSEVYGDPEVHPQTESYNGNVNIRGVRGCYDESKRFGETLTEAYYRKHNVDVRTVRIFNTYGPKMRPDDGRVVPTFIDQALSGNDLTVYGDGSQTRSFCYVDDLIHGLTQVMEQSELDHRVYNLGNENEITIKTLAKKILDIVNTNSSIVYKPLPEDDPERRKPNITRIQKELGWEPNISLENGLKTTIDSYK